MRFSAQFTWYLRFLLLGGAFSIMPCIAQAQNNHTVKEKETLYSISKKYSITVDQLKKWNRLKDNYIAIGQVLLVKDPFKESEVHLNPVFETEKSTPEIHIVQKGETLFGIAKHYQISVADLRLLNQLKKDGLDIGQKLVVKVPEATNLATENQNEFLTLEKYIRYKVAAKESAKDIAHQFDMSVRELEELNEDIDINHLVINQEINVIQPSRIRYANPYLVTLEEATDSLTGIPAFVYSKAEEGNVTTSGELISNGNFTCAHPSLPFGSIIIISNTATNQSVFARVNDRTMENAIKITEDIKKAIGYNPIAQQKIIVSTF